MDRTNRAPIDPSLKYETKDYKVIVGQQTGQNVAAEARKCYFVQHKQDGVNAGQGNQLVFAIQLAIKLQADLDEVLAQMQQVPSDLN